MNNLLDEILQPTNTSELADYLFENAEKIAIITDYHTGKFLGAEFKIGGNIYVNTYTGEVVADRSVASIDADFADSVNQKIK